MAKAKTLKTNVLKTKIEAIEICIFTAKAKDLVKIGYVSERGVKEEKAAVQRIFSPRRVTEIAEFVSKGGGFFSPFIINWNNQEKPLKILTSQIEIPLEEQSAQLLDGQHRFRGIQQAIENETSKGDENVVIILTNNLETREAANIFTNINSKQQSVSKSLIYDLFKELAYYPNHEINRATDIAIALNTNEDSPYFGKIIFPGKNGLRGTIQLSTVVDSLKDHLKKDSTFERRNIKSLQYQVKTILNFFTAISLSYEEVGLWNHPAKNPFLGSAGFRAGIDVLTTTVLDKSAEEKSLKIDFFKKILSLESKELLTKDAQNFKALSGKEQVKYISNFLTENIQESIPTESEYEL